jgi:ABC-type multidrug transport system ATPase subunit
LIASKRPEALTRVLEARNVTKAFGSFTALRRLSLSFSPGEVTLLVGANGAGKSTLLKLLSGLLRPDSGEVVSSHKQVGFFSHHLFLYGRLSVRENLELFGAVRGIRDIDKYLGEMDLLDVASRPVSELSKGTQARVGIARALLGSPDLVVLDEPTSNLDERGTLLLLGAMKRVRRVSQGKAIFVVASHDLHRLTGVSSRAVVLSGGEVALDSGKLGNGFSFFSSFFELFHYIR